MERNYYTDRFLDEDFEEAVKSKVEKVQEKYTEQQLKDLYFDNAQKIIKVLISFKPNRHQKEFNRKDKRSMLEYLDRCIEEDLSKLSYKEKVTFKNQYTDKVGGNLTFLGFELDKYWIFFSLLGLVIDVVLIFFGIAKYYFYVPVFFLLIGYKQFKGMKRAKKEGKLLRW